MEHQQLTIVRTFAAPLEKVWQSWTTPGEWVRWYGKPWDVPADSAAMDLKVDGRWKSTTIAQGHTINFTGQYKVIEAPHRLVFTIENPDNPQDTHFETVTAIFKAVGDHTTEVTFTQSGNLPAKEYQGPLKEGWSGFFDALDKHLASV